MAQAVPVHPFVGNKRGRPRGRPKGKAQESALTTRPSMINAVEDSHISRT